MIIKSNFSINHDSVLCHFDIIVTCHSTWIWFMIIDQNNRLMQLYVFYIIKLGR